jgi:hypothetical protein
VKDPVTVDEAPGCSYQQGSWVGLIRLGDDLEVGHGWDHGCRRETWVAFDDLQEIVGAYADQRVT